MNDLELMNRILVSGADEKGIRDRFSGNTELYAECFREFLEEPCFALLRDSIEKQDYEQAFLAAHGLKGLSGNLGLTGFYNALCPLVESLRQRNGADVPAQYKLLLREEERLRRLLSDEPDALPPEALSATLPTLPSASKREMERKNTRFFVAFFCLLAVVLLCVAGLFGHLFINYHRNIETESVSHLLEINKQIELYIEGRIESDWKTAHSIGSSIAYSNYTDDDAAIFELLRRQKQVWGVTEVKIYTENGFGVSSNGETERNDVASDAVVRAWEQGEYLTVLDSDLIYTVPVETRLLYRGSRIVAVAVVQSMGSFLDEMGFSSFGDQAWMALTEENGIVFSMLTNANAIRTFNILAIVGDRGLTTLGGRAGVGDLLAVTEPTAFLMSGSEGRDYLISTPLYTRGAALRLFYVAPESVVNRTMDGFSRQLMILSISVIGIFLILATMVFMSVYRTRKRLFDRELRARERMFDLLVSNTSNAFGLFAVNEPQPVYISANAVSIIGERFFLLRRNGERFSIESGEAKETDVVRQLNERIGGWDGKSEFKSGFIRNERSTPPRWFELQLYPVDAEELDFVGIAHDTTQAYEREQATRAALEMAERSNDAKSRFLSNMSHDIRTPMNAIMNMTDFALENIDQPKRLSFYLQTIHESSEHLLRLINDVLDMSRIESGQTVLASAPFDLREELKRQCDMIRPLCAAKHQTLITDFDGVLTAEVCGDRLKFSQIIMNLLSNAVKFTPERGAVRFSAREIPSLRGDMVDMRFTVEDNGIGISPDYIQHIFEPFSRADDRRVDQIEGTGLGLSICRSYVDAMGGTLQCESEEGEGSIFTVDLFFQRAESVQPEPDKPPVSGAAPFLGKRCLVAEDNGINQTIARTLLERLGFLVEMTNDGGECLQAFLCSRPGTYDLIYMDIQMPVMDGYQATVAIRESAHAQALTIPIVAMTANVFAEDIEKARIAGMDGYLGKPITSFHLIDETNKAMNKRRSKEI